MTSSYTIVQTDPEHGRMAEFDTRADSDVEAEQAAREWLRDGQWSAEESGPMTVTALIERWGQADDEDHTVDPCIIDEWHIDVTVQAVGQ